MATLEPTNDTSKSAGLETPSTEHASAINQHPMANVQNNETPQKRRRPSADISLRGLLNGRYKIFRKLGAGSQSTVWLAQDLKSESLKSRKFVAVKVFSDDSEPYDQVVPHANVETIFDRFMHECASGSHLCTVSEPLGRSLHAVADAYYILTFDPYYGMSDRGDSDSEGESLCAHSSEEGDHDTSVASIESLDEFDVYNAHKWPTKLSREICRQILLGLKHLHDQGVAHRDVQLQNIMLALSFDLDSMTMDEIQQDGAWSDPDPGDEQVFDNWEEKNIARSRYTFLNMAKRDGRPLEGVDNIRVAAPSALHDRLVLDDLPANLRAVLIDLGFSLPFEDCDQPIYGPRKYRAPESILPVAKTYKADIFTAGMVFWEAVIGREMLYDAKPGAHLRYLETKIGPAPDQLRQIFPPMDEEPGELDKYDQAFGDLRYAALRDRAETMTNEETDQFLDLITCMMQWEPEKRPSCKELLEHPFFLEPYN